MFFSIKGRRGTPGKWRLKTINQSGDARDLQSVDIFGGMNRISVVSNGTAGGTPWNHRKSLPGIVTGEP
jgi:hypothetical protein